MQGIIHQQFIFRVYGRRGIALDLRDTIEVDVVGTKFWTDRSVNGNAITYTVAGEHKELE
jgi:hypothetical protein